MDKHPYLILLDAARAYVEAYDGHSRYKDGAAVGTDEEQESFEKLREARHSLYGVMAKHQLYGVNNG